MQECTRWNHATSAYSRWNVQDKTIQECIELRCWFLLAESKRAREVRAHLNSDWNLASGMHFISPKLALTSRNLYSHIVPYFISTYAKSPTELGVSTLTLGIRKYAARYSTTCLIVWVWCCSGSDSSYTVSSNQKALSHYTDIHPNLLGVVFH